MTRPAWESPEMTPEEQQRQEYEEQKYEANRCPECGEKCCPPEMDVCPYCHPNTDYEREDEMTGVCDCPMRGETDASADRCSEDGPNGCVCTRPDGHDGPHTACNVIEHPSEVWK